MANQERNPAIVPSRGFSLPKVYSRSFIPVDAEEIPTPSKVAKLKYLKLNKIKPFPQRDDDK